MSWLYYSQQVFFWNKWLNLFCWKAMTILGIRLACMYIVQDVFNLGTKKIPCRWFINNCMLNPTSMVWRKVSNQQAIWLIQYIYLQKCLQVNINVKLATVKALLTNKWIYYKCFRALKYHNRKSGIYLSSEIRLSKQPLDSSWSNIFSIGTDTLKYNNKVINYLK